MAADGVQRLDLEDLDAVLERAKVEGWTELALRSGPPARHIGRYPGITSSVDSPRAHYFVFYGQPMLSPEQLRELISLRQLELSGFRIDFKNLRAIAGLPNLTALYLGGGGIGDAGAVLLGSIASLDELSLRNNGIGDAGAVAISGLSRLKKLDVNFNRIGPDGARAVAGMSSLEVLDIGVNPIEVEGARAVARHRALVELRVGWSQVRGPRGNDAVDIARAILDEWIDPATAERRVTLELPFGPDAPFYGKTDAQALIAAWRQQKEQEAARAPLPDPEAAGEPVAHGVQVRTAPDGRLTLVDPALGAGARDDETGRELHGELIAALDRLIAKARQSNAVAEWREAAEAAKERLGDGPLEVRVSAILRIERLRSLREADERRRSEPDPLVEPAEAGVATALRDAVAAANLYVETDPHLAEHQRRLADPGLDLAISTEEAEAAEAEMDDLDIADPALLAELRLGRETAAAGGRAGERALAWLAGSWRNVVREMLRQVLAWVRGQVKAARAGASGIITIEQTRAVLASMGLYGLGAITGVIKASAESAGRVWRHGEPVLGKGLAGLIMLFLADHVGLLTRLGWSPEFAAQIQRLLAGIAG